jgi:cytochrome-b5 reductase
MSVKIKNPSLEIERSYTPLNLSPNEIHVVVKRYAEGELSRFLHILKPGVATVWVKQGRTEWAYEEGKWDHIVFVVGGTGITPAFQLCLNALQRQKLKGEGYPGKKKTKFTVLAATRDVKSVLLREEFKTIDNLYGDGNLQFKYFLDTVPTGTKLPGDLVEGPITEKIIHDTIRPPPVRGWLDWRKPATTVMPDEENVMILVCGPDGFTRYIAGPHGGVVSKQGVKGGLLQNVEGIEVFKLLESRNVDDAVMSRKKEGTRGPPVMKVE